MHVKIHNKKKKKAKLTTEKEGRRNVPTKIPFGPKKLLRRSQIPESDARTGGYKVLREFSLRIHSFVYVFI